MPPEILTSVVQLPAPQLDLLEADLLLGFCNMILLLPSVVLVFCVYIMRKEGGNLVKRMHAKDRYGALEDEGQSLIQGFAGARPEG